MPDVDGRPVVQFSTPSGLVDVAVGGIIVSDGIVSGELDMPGELHDAALREGWFHLGPLTSGPGAGAFGSGGDVRIQARLDPRLVAGLGLVVATPAGVGELLGVLDVTSPLRSQASWYACSATRAVALDETDLDPDLAAALVDGSLREGYRTAWGGDAVGAALPIVAYVAEQLERRFDRVEALVEQPGFRWTLTGSDAAWTTTALVDETAGWCVLFSVVDDPPASTDRSVLVERASDLNTALLFGAWHVAHDSSTVGFRSGVELPDRSTAPALLEQLLTRHLDIVDEYASAFR